MNFKSIKQLKRELEDTLNLIHSIQMQRLASGELYDLVGKGKFKEYKPDRKSFKMSNIQAEKVFELGYITLFAAFEHFTTEFLKELYQINPWSISPEKQITYAEISGLKSIGEIKKYVIDSISIDMSYNIDKWHNHLRDKFKINAFKDNDQIEVYKIYSAIRNLYLHSGGVTNSKFHREMRVLIKSHVPIGEKVKFNRADHFNKLDSFIKTIIKNIEYSLEHP